jgi:S-adenosylmethionine synthetase
MWKKIYSQWLSLNALDDLSRGLPGLYLTVTGLSCENGDSGQVGHGNRVSGLISFMRPQTMEAWAIPEVSESTITLVGKIGSPVHQPLYVYSDFKIRNGNDKQVKEKVLETLKKLIASKSIFII